MSDFIQNMESMLSLFKSVHSRAPHNSQEFADFCEHVKRNSYSSNSRRRF